MDGRTTEIKTFAVVRNYILFTNRLRLEAVYLNSIYTLKVYNTFDDTS